MVQERYFSRVRHDVFRPFTGRHRGIAFEVAIDLYDRLLGATADYDLVLNRERLTDIVGTTIAKNRDLIVGPNEPAVPEAPGEDDDLDQSLDDRDYARRLIPILPNMESCNRIPMRRITRSYGASPWKESASPKCSRKRGGEPQAGDNAASALAGRPWNPSCARETMNISSMHTSIRHAFSRMSVRSLTSSTNISATY